MRQTHLFALRQGTDGQTAASLNVTNTFGVGKWGPALAVKEKAGMGHVWHRELNPDTVTHLSTITAQRRLTLLVETNAYRYVRPPQSSLLYRKNWTIWYDSNL